MTIMTYTKDLKALKDYVTCLYVRLKQSSTQTKLKSSKRLTTNSMDSGTRRFNAAFTKALQ